MADSEVFDAYNQGRTDERARILAGVAALSTDWLHEDVIHFRDDVLAIVRGDDDDE